jgi:flavin-dependent dehydrogenase
MADCYKSVTESPKVHAQHNDANAPDLSIGRACDVCVFGAGPAGIAVATKLAATGVSVLLLERPLPKKPWGGESFSGAIRTPLRALGCWEQFENAGHRRGYERQSAWGSEPRAESSIFRVDGPFWHVDRKRFDDDLRPAAFARGIPLLSYRRLDSVIRESDSWRLVLDVETRIRARYLVDATGRSRALARRLHARIESHDRLIGLCSAVSRREDGVEIRCMMLEATPFGWWYAAPTPNGHVVAILTDADLAPVEVRRRLRPVAANSAFTHMEALQGWLPVGDACASHDPLCGWGVFRALTNGILAADAIAAFLIGGNPAPLEDYRHHCRRQYTAYLKGLAEHYSIEQRWPESPFWQRRRRPISAATA